jgi:formylglycine-generating enzyme required for sulfatase activity
MRNALDISTLDMPTEAEWEFACRAGTTSGRYDGSEYNAADPAQDKIDFAKLGYIANDWSSRPQNVGLRTPNGYGLYDMYGNVAEWCLDRYAGIYATSGSYVIAPVGPDSGTGHPVRGAWSNYGGNTTFGRSAFRYEQDPTVGAENEGTNGAQSGNPRGYRLVCTF